MSAYKKMPCKGTLRQVSIRVYRLESGDTVSNLLFSTHFVNCCLLSGQLSLPTPLPCVNKYTVYNYTYTVCEGRGYGGSWPQTDKHLPQSLFTCQFC